VSDIGPDNQQRDIEIARNESARQTRGDIRISAAAITFAVLLGLAALGWWVLSR
jgi:hypothetical protein